MEAIMQLWFGGIILSYSYFRGPGEHQLNSDPTQRDKELRFAAIFWPYTVATALFFIIKERRLAKKNG